ncbi:Isoquinoline 1-oxidoreductase subunit [Sphingomonas alpina]|nr:Isoquinoline 1-oxidoreductase subunit [Sphingomonas alpina]
MIMLRHVVLAMSVLALPVAVLAGGAGGQARRMPASSVEGGPAGGDARSAALFVEMGKVIQSPRCLNCHPRTDRPNQGDAMTQHNPPVVRGPDGHGAAGLECATCHGPANVAFANGSGSIPGHPNWHLAPIAMAWEGKTLRQICEQIKDPKRNDGKTLEQLIEHNSHDSLVGWAWNPGKGRTPAPGTQAEFGALTRAWVESGAKCPA